MRSSLPGGLLALAALLSPALPGSGGAALAAEEPAAAPSVFAVRAGKILTQGPAGVVDDGLVVVRDGKFAFVGKFDPSKVPAGAPLEDLRPRWLVPGFIDLHSHVGGGDINDMTYPVNPDLRTLDNVTPDSERLRDARAGGVTTINFIPGSGTNSGGWGTLMKTRGTTLEEVLVRFPGALKIAQLGNPERRGDVGSGRMGMNWLIRSMLERGRDYAKAWEEFEAGRSKEKPAFDARMENFRGLFARKWPIIVHTAHVQGVQASMRILLDEMGLDVILTHGDFLGFKGAEPLGERNMKVNIGPRNYWYDAETSRLHGQAAEWYRRGTTDLSLCTDAPVVPQEELLTQVAMAVRYGLPPDHALASVTSVPARQIGMGDRLGSIEAGKDADFSCFPGDPFDLRNGAVRVWVDGKVAYDPARDGRRF
ncbi:MAG: amidohydrolase family protein [Planctomycetes bacterium]|nr:amidohydrolase family protein [Planctomycetota bacterium]